MFFFDDDITERPLEVRKRVDMRNLKRLEYPRLPRTMAPDPLALPVGSEVVFDVECFRNYFEVGFKHLATGQYFFLDATPERPMRIDLLRAAMWHFKLIGFHSSEYDLPMIDAALRGYTVFELKELSDEIIIEDKRIYSNAPYNHIDLFSVAPLEGSLKLYGARLHASRIQELPIDAHAELTPQEIADTIEYNFNDLDLTELIYIHPKYGLRPHVEMREMLGKEIGEDLRSKSDAQVAETFINARLKAITGRRPQTPTFPDGYSFKYQAPAFLQFQTPKFQAAFETIKNATFYLNEAGRPIMPPELDGLAIEFGACIYRMGIGGLHSSEKTAAHRSDEDISLIDRDVASFYPWLIINNEWFPEHLGRVFLQVYRDDLVLRRLALKKLKDKLEAGLKIAINGTFGKLGNVYSTIYSPNLLMQVTITGQLSLLMFIEMLELEGIPVVSANTDGVVMKLPKSKHNVYQYVISMWEQRTALTTEETRYKATYARDVNNYIALTEDGEVKTKGTYSEKGSAQNSALSKNPEALICSDAVKKYLLDRTPIEQTVRGCTDIRRFVTVRNVKGGAHKDGYYLGRTVRWYYSTRVGGTINYVSSGNKVPNSEGACPYMELGAFPADLNFVYYIRRAEKMLAELGVFGNATRQVSFF
jgi:hypothetical protein